MDTDKVTALVAELANILKEEGLRLVGLKVEGPKKVKKPKEPKDAEAKKSKPKKKAAIEIRQIELPDYMQNEEKLRGVCVGACIYTGKWSKGKRVKDDEGKYIRNDKGEYLREPGSVAHAHTGTQGPFHGYICFASMEEFNKHLTCKHELAHIATDEGHTKPWAEKYVSYGGPKWLTVEWLQNKYGFDDAGNEGTKLMDEWRKWAGLADTNETEQEGGQEKKPE